MFLPWSPFLCPAQPRIAKIASQWALHANCASAQRRLQPNQSGNNADNAPGRTEKLIRMTRETFGDEMVLARDGNGSYAPDEAIRIGRILEAYNFLFYEEPVPWDWYEEQKQVADVLDIQMAGGEEEFRMRAFRWLIANDAFDIVAVL